MTSGFLFAPVQARYSFVSFHLSGGLGGGVCFFPAFSFNVNSFFWYVILHKGLTNLSISTLDFFYHITPRIYKAGRVDWMDRIDGRLEMRGGRSRST